ncbi:peptidylprolyl isomerase [Pyxidicoccus caerfyrddinensis]|uniref:peptidylprolyl isomerase n=1 Tax=Pyxidicoccus caerfyrddinensis TaxID=2709663 RepID=UPI0013DB5C01|nr:peptidyl-prolyl cis-trans isomerase [Pyxidicoccus caerfyrddinensis]
MRMLSPSLRLPLLASLVLLGCSGDKSSGSEAANGKQGPVVALVNGQPVTAEEVEAKLREQPAFIRARYATPEKKKEFLDNLIRFELLAQEAQRAGLDKDPEIQATLQKVMVQKLLRQQQEATGTLSETELRKYYDEHLSEFVRPERVRVSHIFLPAVEGDTAKRNQARAAATKLLADVKAKSAGANTSAFELAAAEHSWDKATKSAGGDLGFLSREELTQAWEAPLAAAAFAITADSGVGPVVETSKGFHLVKLLGRQLGTNQDFDSVKARIESRLLSERRARALDDFIAGLKSKAKIEVRDDVLAQVKVDAEGAPALPPTSDARQP